MKWKWVLASFFAVIMAAHSPMAFAQVVPPAAPAMPGPMAPEAGGGSKIEKKDKKASRAPAKSSNSNKGGELRGLDRADQRAGQNGLQGRDTARTRQGR